MKPHFIEDCPKYILKGTSWSLQGFSEAGNRTGFYFSGPNILLDAGVNTYKNPSAIFITHSHTDHVQNLPPVIQGPDRKKSIPIYVPPNSADRIDSYIKSYYALDHGDFNDNLPNYNIYKIDENTPLVLSGNIRVDSIKCNHKCNHNEVECFGFSFSISKHKLKKKFKFWTPNQIKRARESGEEILEEIVTCPLVYMGDTEENVLDEIMAYHRPETIITECTILHEKNRISGHTCWENGLENVVRKYPETTFILIHWSRRYNDTEIQEFFNTQDVKNVILWLRSTS